VQALVTGARNGLGGAIVVWGEPGIGKTALVNSATSDMSGVQLVRADGYEAESSIPYAGLQRVGVPLIDHLAALSPRHQQALRVAWGNDDGPVPDGFLVGLAMLALFGEAGSQRPVVCVVDDAHWLDSESLGVLAFVGRRLQAESTALLFAARDSADTDVQLAGMESIRLTGLDDASAVQLLMQAAPDLIDPFAATQIATATGGNPLALIDLAEDLDVRQLSDLSLSREPIPIGRHLEAHYLRQVRETPRDVQRWLLLAAAEAGGQARLITMAAEGLGLSPDCAADAERAGLVSLGDTVLFRHPLVRSAVYAATPAADRRRVHAALAHGAAQLGLVELEAWHAAEATPGTDTAVAARLEAVAERAARRGGLISQARLLARAADLTPSGWERNGILLAAAEAAGEAGSAHISRELLDRIDPEDLDPVQRGRMITARTALAVFIADRAIMVGAAASMLNAAGEFHGRDPELEQKALLAAFELILSSDSLTKGTTLKELGRRLDAGSQVKDGPSAAVLRALAALVLLPYGEAVPFMRAALDTLFGLDDADLLEFDFIGFVFTTALFDEAASERYLDRLAQIARDSGALRTLDTVLWIRSLFELDRGDPSAAKVYIDQVREVRRAVGYDAENVINISYLAWTGKPRDQVEAIIEITRQMGFGGVYTSAQTALGVRDIAEGHYRDAYNRFSPTIQARFVQVTQHQFADYVEAAARSGHLSDASHTAAEIGDMAQASGTPWLRGLDKRCQALLADDANAEAHFQHAIELLATAHVPSDLGRAHLLYGEWLRRQKRRREARDQLRTAVGIFDRIDAPAFAQRARSELAATGEKISERQLVAGAEMSPREAAVARMAADGNTNAEIGAALFISTNTVDYHLRKVFSKLGISSRRQLAEGFKAAD
jgi:DNA-binding CsgD family transcriptional regulator